MGPIKKIKNFWKDFGDDGRRGFKLIFWSIVAIIIMKLLNFVFSDITIFMLIGWLVYAILRIYNLKEERERLEEKASRLIDASDRFVGELKEKITKLEDKNKK